MDRKGEAGGVMTFHARSLLFFISIFWPVCDKPRGTGQRPAKVMLCTLFTLCYDKFLRCNLHRFAWGTFNILGSTPIKLVSFDWKTTYLKAWVYRIMANSMFIKDWQYRSCLPYTVWSRRGARIALQCWAIAALPSVTAAILFSNMLLADKR